MLRICLLGSLEVDAGVAEADVPAGRPARLLLGWLAAFPGEHARAEVAARLWPDVLDSSARASLRTALSELRAALGPAAVHVRATRETVELGGHGLWVDLRAFSELVARGRLRGGARAVPRRGAGGARRGVGAGPALAARGRASGRGRRADARGDGGGGGARRRWRGRAELVAWDPLDEAAERELMLALAAAGDRAAALRSYAEFSRRLARELRLAPSGGDARARVAAAAVRSSAGAASASGLPLPRAPRCGRGGAFAGRRGGERSPARGARARAERRALCRVGRPASRASARRGCSRSSRMRCTGRGARAVRPLRGGAGDAVPAIRRRRWRRSRSLSDARGRPRASSRQAARASRPPTRRATERDCSTRVAEWLEEARGDAAARARCSTTCTGPIGRRCCCCAAWRRALSASRCSCSEAPGTTSWARATRSRRRSPTSGATGRSSGWPCTGSTRRPSPPSSRRDGDAAGSARRAQRCASEPVATRSSFGELAQHAADGRVAAPSVLEVVAARAGRLAEAHAAAARARRSRRLRVRRGACAGGLGGAGGHGAGRDRRGPAGGLAEGAAGTGGSRSSMRWCETRSSRRCRSPRRAYLHRRIARSWPSGRERAPERWLAPLAHHALAGAPG